MPRQDGGKSGHYGAVFPERQALNNSELLARSRELQLVELAVSHFLRFADQPPGLLNTVSPA